MPQYWGIFIGRKSIFEALKKRIAIFASGSGSNAQKIIEHFKKNEVAEVAIVISNNPEAYVLERADNFEIPTQIITREDFYSSDFTLRFLEQLKVDFIVLAGFLWLIPDNLIKAYPQKIVNIHPALLPKFGGKGMYGHRVHEAVLEAKEKESGITIHFVNEHYDEGEVVLQVNCPVEKKDTSETLAFRIQQLEHQYFPKTVETLLKKI